MSTPANRQMVALRPSPDLRAQLEAAADQSGRPVSKEAEIRLAQSFSSTGLFTEEQKLYLNTAKDVARYIEALAEVYMRITRLCRDGGLKEDATREALREASAFLTAWFMWRGEEVPRAEIPKGARLIEQPPALIGRKVAEDFMLYLNAFHEGGALQDALEGRIMNVYSGDGRTQISPATE